MIILGEKRMNNSFEIILSMVFDACNEVFPGGDYNIKTEILECATKIYVAYLTENRKKENNG